MIPIRLHGKYKQNNNYNCGLHMLLNIALLHKVSLTIIVCYNSSVTIIGI